MTELRLQLGSVQSRTLVPEVLVEVDERPDGLGPRELLVQVQQASSDFLDIDRKEFTSYILEWIKIRILELEFITQVMNVTHAGLLTK